MFSQESHSKLVETLKSLHPDQENVVVDFAIRKSPQYRIAERTLEGKWPGDKAILAEFVKVQTWAKEKRLRTGKWFFLESGGEDESPNASCTWRWE